MSIEVADRGWDSLTWFAYSQPCSEFWLSTLILKVQRTSMSLKSWLGFWRTLEVPDLRLESLYWFEYGHQFLINQCSKFWLSTLILKEQRTSIFINFWIRLWRTLEVPDRDLEYWSSCGQVHLSYTHDPNFGCQHLFWKCKGHMCPLGLDSDFGGCWRLQPWARHLDLTWIQYRSLIYPW